MTRSLLLALALPFSLSLGAAAWADTAVATSSGADAPITANDKPAAPLDPALAQDGGPAPEPKLYQQIHGEVGVSVGSGDYRSAYVTATAPLGDRGMVGISVSGSRGRGYYGYGPGAYGPDGYGPHGSGYGYAGVYDPTVTARRSDVTSCVETSRDQGLAGMQGLSDSTRQAWNDAPHSSSDAACATR